MTTEDATATIRRYVLHSYQYLENGLVALQRGEAGKAGELFWGSVAEALQAVAAYNNKRVRTHRDLKNFAIQLSRDLNDSKLAEDVAIAESLHHNFYEVQQEPEDVGALVPVIQALVAKIIGLVPPQYHEMPAPV